MASVQTVNDHLIKVFAGSSAQVEADLQNWLADVTWRSEAEQGSFDAWLASREYTIPRNTAGDLCVHFTPSVSIVSGACVVAIVASAHIWRVVPHAIGTTR